MKKIKIARGMSLRDARAAAVELGCHVRQISATGEDLYSHTSQDKAVRINARRKDAPLRLVAMLAKVQEAQESAEVS